MITNIMRRLACSKPTQTHMSLRLTKGYENITPSPTPPIEGGEIREGLPSSGVPKAFGVSPGWRGQG